MVLYDNLLYVRFGVMNHCAMVTVCTEVFLRGTLVTLASFLKHNSWFSGDLLVFHKGLSRSAQERLSALDRRVVIKQVDKDLDERVESLVGAMPNLASRQARFYSLSCFALEGYDKILFVDSDVLFLSTIVDAFREEHSFMACPDATVYRGGFRKRDTFKESLDKDGSILATFNAGFMIFSPKKLPPNSYATLLAELSRTLFEKVATGHTDQFVLNRYFEKNLSFLSSRFNYLLGFSRLYKRSLNFSLRDAAVLHFNGPVKPWANEVPNILGVDEDVIWALKCWRNEWQAIEIKEGCNNE